MSNTEILSILQSIEKRLSVIESNMGNNSSVAGNVAVVGGSDDLPRSIKAYDEYCQNSLIPFLSASAKIGGDAEAGGKLIEGAWCEMRKFLLMASKCKEPAATAVPPLLSGLVAKLKDISALTKKNEYERHLKTLSEVLYSQIYNIFYYYH